MEDPFAMLVHVAVAGDYEIVVAGLSAVLEPFRTRVRLRSSGPNETQAPQPDVVLYDPDVDHDAPAFVLRSRHPAGGPKLVVFSWLEDPKRVNAAHACGADAQISKTLTPADLVDSIERINGGERIGLRTSGPASAAVDLWPGAEYGLSGRESQILMLICQGLSNAEIAVRAYIGINTVKTYIRSCYRKIGVATRPQAVIWAMDHGFSPSQEIKNFDPLVNL